MKLACAAAVVAALGSFASFAPAPAAQESAARPPQDVIVIGTLGGPTSILFAVNARGQAVGWSDVTSVGTNHAILWEDGRVVDLGLLPGDDLSYAFGINDRGQIVGASSDLTRGTQHAVLWQDGRMIPLSPPDPDCYAIDINNHGEIAGTCEDVPVVWRDGDMVPIGLLPGFSSAIANAINDKGAIVGSTIDFALVQSGFLWQDGRLIELADSGVTMVPFDVNDHGQVVGYAPANPVASEIEPVIWEDGRIRPVSGTWGSFHGTAWGINDRGEVVVSGHDASHAQGTVDRAFVWANGEFRPLPGLGQTFDTPFDISKHGVAVGSAQDANGFQRGIIWPRAVTRPHRGPS
jgi:probable HAF family extracellular repeat protein